MTQNFGSIAGLTLLFSLLVVVVVSSSSSSLPVHNLFDFAVSDVDHDGSLHPVIHVLDFEANRGGGVYTAADTTITTAKTNDNNISIFSELQRYLHLFPKASAIIDTWAIQTVDDDLAPGNKDNKLDLDGVFFIDENNGWVGTRASRILNTVDGGNTWTSQTVDDTRDNITISAIYFTDHGNGWASSPANRLFKTSDGGANWTQVNRSVFTFHSMSDMQFINATYGWISGEKGEIRLLNGTTWTPHFINFTDNDGGDNIDVLDISFVDDTYGWAVGGNNNISHTTDGGITWTNLSSGQNDGIFNFNNIDFIDRQNGLAAGTTLILRTSDGGDTWAVQTRDAGDTDNDISTVNTVDMLDSNFGWAVLGNQNIQHTNGSNWFAQTNVTSSIPLTDIQILDSAHGWAVGNGGIILIGSDTTAPAFDETQEPSYTQDTGTLVLTFNDYIDASEIDVSKISIVDSNGENGISLTNATFDNTDSTQITVQLNNIQLDAVSALQNGSNLPIRITILEEAFKDLGGNFFAPINTQVGIIADSTIPTLGESILDLGAGTLTFVFSESINVSDVVSAEFTLSDGTDTNTFSLAGVNFTTLKTDIIFSLTETQRQFVIRLQNDSDSSITVTISGDAVQDGAGQKFKGVDNLPLRITPDAIVPGLNTATLDLVAGIVHLNFTETINISSLSLSAITITDNTDANDIELTDATLPYADTTTDQLLISLSEEQRQSVTLLQHGADTAPLQISIASLVNTQDLITDTVGNNFSGGKIPLTLNNPITNASWMAQESNTSQNILGAHFVNPNMGWAAGSAGTIRHTTDGGATWDSVNFNFDTNLHHVYFVNQYLGWVVGDGGMVYHTDNGGVTWNTQTTTNETNLFDVYFINQTRGWAAGENGTVIATVDGGTTWGLQTSGTTANLRNVHFANSTFGWAVGSSATVIATTDGGVTWVNQTSPNNTTNFEAVHFVNSTHGWAAGSGGAVIATTDGGTTWANQTSRITTDLGAIHFIDSNRGWAAGNEGVILATTDGGQDWGPQTTPDGTPTLYDIHLTDTGHGWAVGNDGTVIHNYFPDAKPPLLLDDTPELNLRTGILSIRFDKIVDVSEIALSGITITNGAAADRNNITLTGATVPAGDSDTLVITLNEDQRQAVALIYHNADLQPTLQIDIGTTAISDTDGLYFVGITNAELTISTIPPPNVWDTQSLQVDENILDIHFTNSTHGWTVGNTAAIHSTIDGGDTWNLKGIGATDSIHGIHFTDSNSGWAVGNDGQVIRTTDGGVTWTLQTINGVSTLYDVYFVDTGDNGWAVGDNGVVITTTNGGDTWTTQTSNVIVTLNDVDFVDANRGWAVGNTGTIITTTNGGDTWTTQTSNVTVTLNDVDFVDANRGWAVGNTGTIITTTNSGDTWITQDIDSIVSDLETIHFINSHHGWAAGLSGTILYTSDGGTTWIQQTTPTTNSLRSIHFPEAGYGWAAGDNGVILRTLYSDTVPPLLVNDTPVLDLGMNTMSISFDEVIDASATDFSGITVTNPDGGLVIFSLDDTAQPDFDSTTLTITLNDNQITEIKALGLSFENPSLLQITVSSTAVVDLAGNNFAGFNNNDLAVFADNIPPTLAKTAPILNLDTATLSFTFDEIVDVSNITIAGISITDRNGENGVTFTNATVPDISIADPATLILNLTSSLRQSIVILNTGPASPVQINVTATAIKDLNGNNFAGLNGTELTIIDDATPPILRNTTLDLNTATISFTFNEYIDVLAINLDQIFVTDGTGTVTVTLTGATLPDTNSTSFVIGLVPDQVDSIRNDLVFTDADPLQITVSDTAIADLTGIYFAGIATALQTTDGPTLIDDTLALNLNTGILTLTFDEDIDVSELDLTGITLTDNAGANTVTLTGATASADNSDTITITLTDQQRQDLVIINTGTPTTIRINIADTAVQDIAGNAFAGITDTVITTTRDATPPLLDTPSPNLDILARTLSFTFNEYIDVSAIILSGISITDGTGTVTLSNNTLPDTDSASFTIGLTIEQIQSIKQLSFTDDDPLLITVSATAIPDLTGNHFVELTDITLDTTDDTDGPTLIDDTLALNLNTATLSFTFNEDIDVSELDLTGITLTDNAGANTVTLTGATPPTDYSNEITIILTDQQRQDLVIINIGTPTTVLINIADTVVKDIAGNAFAGITDTVITTTSDGTPPLLEDLSPNLNIIDRTLSFTFNEYIDVLAINLDQISVTNGTGTVILTNATLPDTNSATVVIGITVDQVNLIRQLTFSDTGPLQITVSATAFADLAGNSFAELTTTLQTTDDTDGPTLIDDTLALNLNNATLSFTFDEDIDVSELDLTGITLTDNAGANTVTLTGATPPTENSNEITIILTEPQRQSLVIINIGTPTTVLINIADTVVKDIAGNAFAGITDTVITTTRDATPPLLDTPPPNLDILARTLSFTFNEYIDVSAIILSGISITDGTGTVTLSNNTLPDTDSASFTIGLTIQQIQSIKQLSFTDDDPLLITVSATAIPDLTGNHFVELTDITLDTTDDTDGPTLIDDTLALNLNTATISFTFNEDIDVSELDLTGITLTDNAGANTVTLTGATLPTDYSNEITIILTEPQRQSLVIINIGTPTTVLINIADTVVKDIAGNAFAGITDTVITTTRDATPPLLEDLSPNLNIIDRTLSFTFNEYIDVSAIILSDISITDGTGTVTLSNNTLPDTDSASFTIGLTIQQIQSINELTFTDANPLQITVSATAFKDLAGNSFAELTTTLQTTDDTDGPTLIDDTLALNLNTATISFTFNEDIDVSELDLTGITLTDNAGANTVTLTGATLPTDYSNEITIILTEPQRQSLVIINIGTPTTVLINIADTVVKDIAGNAFAGITDTVITTTRDATPPLLEDLSPNLNIIDRTLSFTFNEYIDVSAIILSDISITDGTGTVTLSNNTLPDTDSASFTIGLTIQQIQSIKQLSFTDDDPLLITVSATAIPDLTGNHFVELTDITLDTTDDTDGPTLIDDTLALNLNTATLSFTFDEDIDVSELDLTGITLTDNAGANTVTLTGATLPTDYSNEITIILTEPQRQSLVIINIGTPTTVLINIADTVVKDIAGNAFAGITDTVITTTRDATPPLLEDLSPNLNIIDRTLSFTFNEYIDVSAIILSDISITDGTGTVTLSNNTLPDTDSASFTIGLTIQQIQSIKQLSFTDDDPLLITVSATAIPDLTGNHFVELTDITLDTTDDTDGPTLIDDTLALNLNTATISFTFNEDIDVSELDLTGITLTDNAGANTVTLTGATLPTDYSNEITIILTEPQRQSLVIINIGTPTTVLINIADTVVKDIAGNAFAGITDTVITTTRDATPPLLEDLSPNLNIIDRTLSFTFNEYIDVLAINLDQISVTNGTGTVILTNATLPDTNSATVVIGITVDQVNLIRQLTFSDTGPLQITVSATAFKDLAGNSFAELTTTLQTTDDTDGPTLIDDTLALNLNTGILTLTFDEDIDVSELDLTGITLTDNAGANTVTLTGATASTDNSDTITITLTDQQRQDLVIINTGTTTAVRINIADTAVQDIAGNAFAGITDTVITTTRDATPPLLDTPSPNLDILARTLSFTFNEYIDVSAIILSGISITDGTGTVTLSDNTLPDTDSASFTLGLTIQQIQSIKQLSFTDDDPLLITVSATAIPDLTGNHFVELTDITLDTTDDTDGPTLIDDTLALNLNTATLSFTFDEDIDVSELDLTGITLTDNAGANTVTLTGATLPTDYSNEITIILTEPQRQSLVIINIGTPTTVLINIADTVVKDIAGNAFAGITDTVITTTRDATPPLLEDLSPNLNIIDRTLSFTFNEYIDVLAINLDQISVTNGTGTVILTNATLPDTNSATVVIGITVDQVNLIRQLTFSDTGPLQITVSATAFADLAGNSFAELTTTLQTTDDTDGPTLIDDTLALNLNTATLSFTFNEVVDVAVLDLTGITLTDDTGANTVTLTGATPPTENSDEITIGLTKQQRQSLVIINTGTPTTIRINIADTVVKDIAGNAFAGITDTVITTTRDATPPLLDTPSPNLDILARTLSFTFNEYIDVSAIILSGISITDGTGTVTLSDNTLPDTDSASFTLGLTIQQIQSINELTFTDANPLQITVSATAFKDLAGNSFAELTTTLQTTDDTDPPTLDADKRVLDLNAKILSLTFNEYIDVSVITLGGITLTDNADQNPVVLTDAIRPANDSNEIIIGLTESQWQSLVVINTGNASPVQIDIDADAIKDLSQNAFTALENGILVITDDTTVPTLADPAPNLDLLDETLTFTFNETIDVSSIILSDISVTDGTDIVSLAGATLPDNDSATVILNPTGLQVELINALNTGANTILQITVSTSAIKDLSGNAFAGLIDVELETVFTVDSISPVPVITLNPSDTFTPTALSPIPITITFSEPVSALVRSDVTVTNGDLTVLTQVAPSDDTTYQGDVTPSIAEGTVSVTIPSGTVTDTSDNGNEAATLEISVDSVSPTALSAQTQSSTVIELNISEPVTIEGVSPTTFVVSTTDTTTTTTAIPVATVSLKNGIINDVVLLTIDADAAITAFDTVTVSYTGTTAGVVSDAPGNTLADFTGLSVTNNIPIPPVVSRVHASSIDDTYLLGDSIDIAVMFTKDVTLTASGAASNPTLLLDTGTGSGGTASYTGIIDDNTLTFRYTVAAGDVSEDLQYQDTSSLVLLSGTTITESGSSPAIHAVTVLPALSSDGSLASNSDIVIDGILAQVLSADMRGENSLEVSYDKPVRVATSHYTNVTVDGISRTVQTVTGSGTPNILVYFDGLTVSQGAGGTMNINSHVTVTGQVISPRTETVNITDNDPVVLISSDISDTLTINDETTTTSVSPVLGLHPLGTGDTLTLPTSLIVVTFDHNVDGVKDVTATFPPDTVVSNLGLDQTITLSISEKTVTLGMLPAGATLTNSVIVELGDPARDIQFDNPVIIDLAGRAGETGFFIDAAGLTEMVPACNSDHVLAADGSTIAETVSAEIELRDRQIGECSVNVGADLRIYSLHFSGWGGFIIDDNADNVQQDRIPRNRSNGGGGGGGGGGHGASSPPSFTTSFATGTDTIIINNIGIAPKPFKLLYVQDDPVTILTDRPVPFSFTLYDDESWQTITHFEICINSSTPHSTFCDGDTKVIWNKNDHNGTPEIIDPNNVIDTASIVVSKNSLHVATFDVDITFDGAVSTTDLQIRSWDAKSNTMEFTVENALVVTDHNNSAHNDGASQVPDNNNNKQGNNNTKPDLENTTTSCAPGMMLLDNQTCMDPEPGTFVCLSDQVMLSDNTCKDVTNTTAPTPDDQPNDRRLIVSMWAGHHANPATDAQLFNVFDISHATVTLPDWFKSDLGSLVAQDMVSIQEFEAALQYMSEYQN